ncbi:putative substrate-binding component of ABC transporter [Streptomyces scabiei 87.22]|uniref:Putative substrate-binding component of ABC transporter n=1 Tax=Streptomyces scabiei (strain 87.22) TaxID=680198 RepID=C9YYU9_STRSW|nr:extracellular solute-binding protein [Streptomyces scabiei]MDX3082800.1 extracellular solute-binding protein [Streptomyces scabiei]MDX3176961.1 extracellular solute-binding protein [Streptomyces scabiei]MDX3272322.1 extracellular solute-binding protein [Streptomyces scabiei]MDX3391690.1 extracellular solute-binding protein [Streptomyces scabiei]CBG68004.1 putative substrate-binding component of ABC transporter [Streptomyces scabiei 87.22]
MTTVGVRRSSRLGRGGMRRLVPLAAGVSAATLLLSACGGGSDSGGTSKSLTFWISTVPGQDAGWKKVVAQYKKEKGVKVKLVNIPYDGYTTKLHNAAQANSLPDVAAVPALDPIWSNKLIDLKSIADKKSNNINQNFLAKDSSGKVLAIPSDVTASGMFINKSLFEKAGVDFPTSPDKTWTWTDFIKAANKVREKTKAKYSLTFDQSPSRLRAMVYEMGGKYVHADDSGKFSVDDATKKAVNTFVGWNDDKTMPKSVWTSGADPSAMFQSGDVVAYWSGVWQVPAFAESIKKFEWASVPTPAQPVQASDVNAGGNIVGFNNNADAAGAAKGFLSWLYEPDNYRTLCEASGFLPVESGLNPTYPFKSEAAQAAYKLYNESIPLYDPISGYFNGAQTNWVLKGKSLTEDPTKTELGKAINGQQSADKALEAIVAGYNQQVGG